MLLDLCKNKSLSQVIRRRKRFHEVEVRYYAKQILKGLKYIHSKNVIHRDIKLGNLFIDENMKIKIGDFGLAQMITKTQPRRFSVCGTPNYLAPEIINGKTFGGHSYEVDIWAFGVIVYVMLVGKSPFEEPEIK